MACLLLLLLPSSQIWLHLHPHMLLPAGIKCGDSLIPARSAVGKLQKINPPFLSTKTHTEMQSSREIELNVVGSDKDHAFRCT